MTYYDEIAEGYTELHKEEQEKKIEIVKREVYFPRNAVILNVGCGPCFFSQKNAIVVGIDPSIELLKRATTIPTKTIRIVGKGESLPFKDQSFDAVVSFTALQNFDDIEQGIKEIKRVTKKNGTITVTFLKKSKKRKEILNLLKKHLGKVKTIEEEKDVIVLGFLRNNYCSSTILIISSIFSGFKLTCNP